MIEPMTDKEKVDAYLQAIKDYFRDRGERFEVAYTCRTVT